MPKTEIDCRGLQCPVPIVRVSRAIALLPKGETLVVHADDPAFAADIQAWSELTGHELVALEEGPETTARLRRVA